MIHRTICRDGRDQSILMGGSSVRHVELLPCRFMVAQVFDVWRCCCAPAWCRVDDRAERQRPARNDGRIRPQNVFAWLPCLEWLLFSFFIILPLLALSWSVYFLFSSFSCVSIFRPRYPYLDKKYIQYVAPCFDGDIVADLCAPHTHTQFISVPNWAHKYPSFSPFSLYTRRHFFADARATGFRSLDRSTFLCLHKLCIWRTTRSQDVSFIVRPVSPVYKSTLYYKPRSSFFLKKRSFFILILFWF